MNKYRNTGQRGNDVKGNNNKREAAVTESKDKQVSLFPMHISETWCLMQQLEKSKTCMPFSQNFMF